MYEHVILVDVALMCQEMWDKMLTNQEKIQIINDRLYNIYFHIDGFLSEPNEEFRNNELLNEYILRKTALEELRDSLV